MSSTTSRAATRDMTIVSGHRPDVLDVAVMPSLKLNASCHHSSATAACGSGMYVEYTVFVIVEILMLVQKPKELQQILVVRTAKRVATALPRDKACATSVDAITSPPQHAIFLRHSTHSSKATALFRFHKVSVTGMPTVVRSVATRMHYKTAKHVKRSLTVLHYATLLQ
jgi:hypothetical protein